MSSSENSILALWNWLVWIVTADQRDANQYLYLHDKQEEWAKGVENKL